MPESSSREDIRIVLSRGLAESLDQDLKAVEQDPSKHLAVLNAVAEAEGVVG
ncbi:hypothetical protein [Arthrobacter castelli]|uniref:hypothetical protein n=1 Tax=Arthrobacter castelli TaxID=271431 RepID=UPI00040C2B1E|nr:hypothetical protein [Arthrobacter castelli]